MGPKATLRAIQAAERRSQRDAQKRQRELERQTKEQAKLSELEQARLEVERFENQLEILLSVHKTQGEAWDWVAIAASVPPPNPRKLQRNERRAKQCMAVLPALQKETSQQLAEKAKLQDTEEFEGECKAYDEQKVEWEKLKSLARKILDGVPKAFTEKEDEPPPTTLTTGVDLSKVVHAQSTFLDNAFNARTKVGVLH